MFFGSLARGLRRVSANSWGIQTVISGRNPLSQAGLRCNTLAHAVETPIREAYIKGISTRSADDLVKALGMTGVSKSQVSRLCGELDERVGAFLNRPIKGDRRPPLKRIAHLCARA